MGSPDTLEHMPDPDGDREDKVEISEFTDRRGRLLILAVMLLPPLILSLVELIRPAS